MKPFLFFVCAGILFAPALVLPAAAQAPADTAARLREESERLQAEMINLRLKLIQSDPKLMELHRKIMALHKELALKIDANDAMKDLIAKSKKTEAELSKLPKDGK
jgi:hypothetical protein